jgi:hypothetical protein
MVFVTNNQFAALYVDSDSFKVLGQGMFFAQSLIDLLWIEILAE